MLENENMRAALASPTEDKIIFDLARIEERYNSLIRELPDVSGPIRDEVLSVETSALSGMPLTMGQFIDSAP